MDDPFKQSVSHTIAQAVTQVLERNSIAVLATLVEAKAGGIGAKILVDEAGELYGSFGDRALDEAVVSYIKTFLHSRAEERS